MYKCDVTCSLPPVSPVTNCHTFSDPLPPRAWRTLWTAPKYARWFLVKLFASSKTKVNEKYNSSIWRYQISYYTRILWISRSLFYCNSLSLNNVYNLQCISKDSGGCCHLAIGSETFKTPDVVKQPLRGRTVLLCWRMNVDIKLKPV